MKRLLLIVLIGALLLGMSSCALPSADITNSTSANDLPKMLSEPYSFNSFEDFEKHEKELGSKALSHYYIPSGL